MSNVSNYRVQYTRPFPRPFRHSGTHPVIPTLAGINARLTDAGIRRSNNFTPQPSEQKRRRSNCPITQFEPTTSAPQLRGL